MSRMIYRILHGRCDDNQLLIRNHGDPTNGMTEIYWHHVSKVGLSWRPALIIIQMTWLMGSATDCTLVLS